MRRHTIFSALKRICLGGLIITAGYVCILAGIVIWAFEVKLERRPAIVYCAPPNLRVGDNIETFRLEERLKRLGYRKTQQFRPDPGYWNQSRDEIRITLKHTSLGPLGVASGPVSIALDWLQVEAVTLLRSRREVPNVLLEPELLRVFDEDGAEAALCRPVPLKSMNPVLVKAVVLTEDGRFFQHYGIDPVSIRRALIRNIRAGRYVEGGSTISQQLIRMSVLSPTKTLARKFNEIVMALLADAMYSKRTILEAYLNRVYFGHFGAFPVKGAAEAARVFFGKDVSDLKPSECALLAAIIRAPNVLNPGSHRKRAEDRRNMVLGLLLKSGTISREEYDKAVSDPVRMLAAGAPPVKAGAFVEQVKDALRTRDAFPSNDPQSQDVLTSLDPPTQNNALDELRGLSVKPGDADLLTADPRTGAIRAMAGTRGLVEPKYVLGPLELLPFVVIPALESHDGEPRAFTLTSSIFAEDEQRGERAVTFRQAFDTHRRVLLDRTIHAVELPSVETTLEEFGFSVQRSEKAGFVTKPVSVFDVARAYARLVNLGYAPRLNTGVRVSGRRFDDPSSAEDEIQADPAVLFLVNYLLKGPEAAAVTDGTSDKSGRIPSSFFSLAEKHAWTVAYHGGTLVVIRIKRPAPPSNLILSAASRLLPEPDSAVLNALPPTGVSFRQTCLESGLRATSICPNVIREPYLKGTEPLQWCPVRHRKPYEAGHTRGRARVPKNR